ncbi:TetR/AcrR family transcriptional regulator [Herpetosiphon giganteus]|uniref:TetR/AcrR family transcriptional regulator n=1 Tax=Herpetosiphon giganteus TaxID=2029754 RepID=UPI00195BACFB|nr:TetR/AcrR family transcriptional regulator [Herpetosiphon giganteus]MBM7845063.1 AcrR family transcriptional regulator [Herpetosiphon giganteus]
MARVRREDWLQHGLSILSSESVSALTIERLTTDLGVTKGSFYHHFGGWPSYKTALLQQFEQQDTLDIIQHLAGYNNPSQKLRALFDLLTIVAIYAANDPWDVEIAMRGWAAHDAEVRAMIERIDNLRVSFVAEICSAITGNLDQGLLMAQHAYVILLGAVLMQPMLPMSRLRQLYDEFLRLYAIPGGPDVDPAAPDSHTLDRPSESR